MKYLLLVVGLIVMPACSHSVIVKECKQVHDDDKYLCKTVLPWQ